MPKEELLVTQSIITATADGLIDEAIRTALERSLAPLAGQLHKVLLIPPDFTRYHSNAGLITRMLYHMLKADCEVDILPALGTHVPVSLTEWKTMFAGIPYEKMIEHNWRTDVVKIGDIPGSFVEQVSEGLVSDSISVEINKHLLNPDYDLILSIGQVVPHEIVGMANQSKNIFVGCGGSKMINASHMLGAFYGIERIMGKDRTPVRAVLDYAAEHFIKDLPLSYILTVTDAPEGNIRTHGLFIGRDREFFERAVQLAQKVNITLLDKPVRKAVVYLDEKEFKSTWLGNKSVYRTRMAIQDGGELIVLAPGIDKFGEDEAVDLLIRKYGYKGREYVLETLKNAADLAENLSAAAHLIHGSSDGRFTITYCTQHLSSEEVENVGYQYLPYQEALIQYPKDHLKPGYNIMNSGEEVYFIPNPALGLWIEKSRLQ